MDHQILLLFIANIGIIIGMLVLASLFIEKKIFRNYIFNKYKNDKEAIPNINRAIKNVDGYQTP